MKGVSVLISWAVTHQMSPASGKSHGVSLPVVVGPVVGGSLTAAASAVPAAAVAPSRADAPASAGWASASASSGSGRMEMPSARVISPSALRSCGANRLTTRPCRPCRPVRPARCR
eukprot:scaffold33722_cov45-Phaeocystis_antarctica.AAC.3